MASAAGVAGLAPGRGDFPRRDPRLDLGTRLQTDRSRRDRGAAALRRTLAPRADRASLPGPGIRCHHDSRAADHNAEPGAWRSVPSTARGGCPGCDRHGNASRPDAECHWAKAAVPRRACGAGRIADGDPTSVATTPTRLAAP